MLIIIIKEKKIKRTLFMRIDIIYDEKKINFSLGVSK